MPATSLQGRKSPSARSRPAIHAFSRENQEVMPASRVCGSAEPRSRSQIAVQPAANHMHSIKFSVAKPCITSGCSLSRPQERTDHDDDQIDDCRARGSGAGGYPLCRSSEGVQAGQPPRRDAACRQAPCRQISCRQVPCRSQVLCLADAIQSFGRRNVGTAIRGLRGIWKSCGDCHRPIGWIV